MKKSFFMFLVVALAACQPKQQNTEETQLEETPIAHNTLTEQQQVEGWKLLFDGQTTSGWRNYKSDQIGARWRVDDNALHFDNTIAGGGGDIITNDEYENFELMLEWRIDSCGNSGIMFNVVEDEQYESTWHTGPEMQVLDNDCHPDAKIVKHRAGDLYDLISCSTETVKPAGEWNHVRIVSNQGNYEFWLNGTKVVTFSMHTPEWEAMVAGSKFKDMPAFGKATKGHIALQDHGDKVWYRNIMIRPL